jgi:hypothetical protein
MTCAGGALAVTRQIVMKTGFLAYEYVDGKRRQNADRNIPRKPGLVADALEPEGDIIGGTAEDGYRERVRQSGSKRPHFCWEQLRLDDNIDRGVAGHDHQRSNHQKKGRPQIVGVLHRRHDWDGEQCT